MICISIAQESRRFALADMINAAPQCDLLELRLDRFTKTVDVSELLARKPRPVIISCRRRQDGGEWDGTEVQRLALLRQAVLCKADYVEIELDVADQVRKFPPSQRVISYTNLQETPADIAGIYAEALTKSPDVIKLATVARTARDAWPLVQILAKATVPTVVTGLGNSCPMLTVLGRKLGSRWTYAALERGMEAYPGQLTVHDLEAIYHYHAITRSTRFVGVVGFGEREIILVKGLNNAFAHLGLSLRCLPLQISTIPIFRKVMDAAKLAGVVVDEANCASIVEAATALGPVASQTQWADLIVRQDQGWVGYNVLGRAATSALEATLEAKAGRRLQGRTIIIVGTNATARSLAWGLKQRGGALIIAGRDRDAARQLAQELGCRYIPFESIYTTAHEATVVCSQETEEPRTKKRMAGLHAGFLRPGLTVLDVTAFPHKSVFLGEAQVRGATVVPPATVLMEQMLLQVKLLTGREVDRAVLEEPISSTFQEEERELMLAK